MMDIVTQKLRQKHRGLSLIEVVVSTLIVGVMLVVALNTLGAVFRSQRSNAARLTGPGLAHELMGEILSLPYEDPEEPGEQIGLDSGESGSDRADFDDVDDYADWNGQKPENKDGVEHPGYDNWEVDVRVNWVQVNVVTTTLSSESGLKLITVTVTDPDGQVTRIHALRSRNSSFEQSPAVDMTTVTWLGAELQLGGSSTARSSTQLSNHTYDTN
jgi:prepilin-type N-terminal cleavage/methylation domain-containing protein